MKNVQHLSIELLDENLQSNYESVFILSISKTSYDIQDDINMQISPYSELNM